MAIKIIKPGLYTTIQDMGRQGYRDIGIGPGGSMDRIAAATANWLAGNDDHDPILEMHFPAPTILFEEDAWIGIAGGDFGAQINEVFIPAWSPAKIHRGDLLSFRKYISGARAYLAVSGGIITEQWLNSYSTNTKVKAGGQKGRALIKDDIIEMKGEPPPGLHTPSSLHDIIKPFYHLPATIPCIMGPEWNWLTDDAKALFINNEFTISSQSDRMGYRLDGVPLEQENRSSLISSPVDWGTIQLLPNGQCVILMADHQTTGGYPRIAQVVSAALPKLAQLPPGTKISFELITVTEAEESLISMQQNLLSIKRSCTL